MAIFDMTYKRPTREQVSSAAAHARYVARLGQYERRGDLVAVTHGNMPAWAAADPVDFWRAADTHERANARLYSEVEFALPRELSREANAALAREFAHHILGTNHAYTLAVHETKALDGGQNIHCHLMFSTRTLDGIERDRELFFRRANTKSPEKGGTKKNEAWNNEELIPALRKTWEIMCNRALERASIEARIDCRALSDRGIERTPAAKLGPQRANEIREDSELRHVYLAAQAAARESDRMAGVAATALARRAEREAAAEAERRWLDREAPAAIDREASAAAADDAHATAEAEWRRLELEHARAEREAFLEERRRREREADAEEARKAARDRAEREEQNRKRQDTHVKAPQRPVEPSAAPPPPPTLLYASDVRERLLKLLTDINILESTLGSHITNTTDSLQRERFADLRGEDDWNKADAASKRAYKAHTELWAIRNWGVQRSAPLRLAIGAVKLVWYTDRLKELEERKARENALEKAYRDEYSRKWTEAAQYARSHESIRHLNEQRETIREQGQHVRDLDRIIKEIDQPGRAIALRSPTYEGIKEFVEQYKRDPDRTLKERSVIDEERAKVVKQKQRKGLERGGRGG